MKEERERGDTKKYEFWCLFHSLIYVFDGGRWANIVLNSLETFFERMNRLLNSSVSKLHKFIIKVSSTSILIQRDSGCTQMA